jgi:hypothetical protein
MVRLLSLEMRSRYCCPWKWDHYCVNFLHWNAKLDMHGRLMKASVTCNHWWRQVKPVTIIEIHFLHDSLIVNWQLRSWSNVLGFTASGLNHFTILEFTWMWFRSTLLLHASAFVLLTLLFSWSVSQFLRQNSTSSLQYFGNQLISYNCFPFTEDDLILVFSE